MKTSITIIASLIFSFNIATAQTAASNNFGSVANNTVSATASTVKVNLMQIAEGIITVKLVNQPKGDYTIQLVNAEGKVIASKDVNHEEGTSAEVIACGKSLEGGMYQVNVTSSNKTISSNKVMLLM